MKNKLKIVIADDQVLYRKWLNILLKNIESVEITGEAENGLQAYELATAIKPELVILDYEMPVMNGLEAAEKILNVLPDTKVMMLTVYKDSVIQKKAGSIGISTFLAKDVAENEIIDVVTELLSKHKMD